MIIYRFSDSDYKNDLSGEGARLYGGRWNSVGSPMLYATEHISLGVLEIMVNKRLLTPMQTDFCLIEMEIPSDSVKTLSSSSLKSNWFNDWDYTQYIGDHFLLDHKIWILRVPSAVIHEEYNFLINPTHTKFNELKLKRSRPYGIDNRLWG
jgi:RES domain-containing protein